jgi:hypothetical protein
LRKQRDKDFTLEVVLLSVVRLWSMPAKRPATVIKPKKPLAPIPPVSAASPDVPKRPLRPNAKKR